MQSTPSSEHGWTRVQFLKDAERARNTFESTYNLVDHRAGCFFELSSPELPWGDHRVGKVTLTQRKGQTPLARDLATRRVVSQSQHRSRTHHKNQSFINRSANLSYPPML